MASLHWIVGPCMMMCLLAAMPSSAQNPAWKTPAPGQAVCCASETGEFRLSSEDVVRRRFQIYKETGFDMLRLEGLGSGIQAEDGQIKEPADLPYLRLARTSGFRLKENINVLGQPEWYFRAHPESQLVNEDGAPGRGEISFWDPATRPRVEQMTDLVFAFMAEHQLFDNVDYIAPDFGPASEPIYPAAWTQHGAAKKGGESFWFYAPNARVDFVRAMTARYGTVAAANAKWKTAFGGWGEVAIPQPGTTPGARWEDVLSWYRDSKNDFIAWQVHNFQAHLARYPQARGVRLLIYVPGSQYTDEEWRQAVATGSGKASIRLMCDSRFLLETAAREGCVLQYTGCENVREVRALFGYMHEKGWRVPMIGENAGPVEDQIERIASSVTDTELAGLDYTHTEHAFGPDLITPTELLPRVRAALTKIREAKGGGTAAAR